MTADAEPRLFLEMSSGKQLIVSRVMLYPELQVQEVRLLRAKAQEEMGGFSTGLGFWGSPGWVIGGAAALGAVESLISNSKMKKGLELLKEAAEKYEKLKATGVLFGVSLINGIDSPNPAKWRASHVSRLQIDLNSLGFLEKAEVIRRYEISRGLITNGIATVVKSTGYIHDEEEFVWVEVDGHPTALRWSFVESYRFSGGSAATTNGTIPEKSLIVAASATSPITGPSGLCPSCELEIPLGSLECPRCKALFGPESAWKVKPLERLTK